MNEKDKKSYPNIHKISQIPVTTKAKSNIPFLGQIFMNRTSKNKTKKAKSYQEYKIIMKNIKKHSVTQNNFNKIIMNSLIDDKKGKYYLEMNEGILNANLNEYLKRYYTIKEAKVRMDKYIKYYKNYIKFFCKPFINSLHFNKILMKNIEKVAHVFYTHHYAQKNKKNEANSRNLNNSKEKKKSELEMNNILFTPEVIKDLNCEKTITISNTKDDLSTAFANLKTNFYNDGKYNENNSNEESEIDMLFSNNEIMNKVDKSEDIKETSMNSSLNDLLKLIQKNNKRHTEVIKSKDNLMYKNQVFDLRKIENKGIKKKRENIPPEYDHCIPKSSKNKSSIYSLDNESLPKVTRSKISTKGGDIFSPVNAYGHSSLKEFFDINAKRTGHQTPFKRRIQIMKPFDGNSNSIMSKYRMNIPAFGGIFSPLNNPNISKNETKNKIYDGRKLNVKNLVKVRSNSNTIYMDRKTVYPNYYNLSTRRAILKNKPTMEESTKITRFDNTALNSGNNNIQNYNMKTLKKSESMSTIYKMSNIISKINYIKRHNRNSSM